MIKTFKIKTDNSIKIRNHNYSSKMSNIFFLNKSEVKFCISNFQIYIQNSNFEGQNLTKTVS